MHDNNKLSRLSRPIVTIAVLGGLSLGACSEAEAELDFDVEDMARAEQPFLMQSELDDLDAPPPQNVGALKLCTIWSDAPNIWRESFIVPQGWTGDTCNKYRSDQGGSWYSLTCLTNTGFQVGDMEGSLPPGNYCGW